MDSLDRAPNDQRALEGTPNEANATLEGVPVVSPSNVDGIGDEVPIGVSDASVLQPRSTSAGSSKKRSPGQLSLSTYVPPYERIHPPTRMVVANLEGTWEIIHLWSPLN